MPKTNRHRVALVLLLLTASASACAEDAAPIAEPMVAPSARIVVPTTPSPVVDPPPAGGRPATIDVAGFVVDDDEEPIIGRPITVVDARSQRFEVMTDEEGGFQVMGVVRPYDVMVAPAPSGAVITPLVYLGLSRSDPRLEVFERQGPIVRPASQPIRVGVRLPGCPASVAPCWVSVVTASMTGGGGTAGSFTNGNEDHVYEVDHAWRNEALAPSESVAVHVLVGNARYTDYAYASGLRVEARPGEATDAGMTTPLPVEAGPPVTIAGHMPTRLPEGWQWTLASQLELPDGAVFSLRYDWSATSGLRVPRLPGASWRVGAWAQRPPVEDHPYLQQSSQAWSGSLPVNALNVSVDVPIAPEPRRPTIEGSLSARGAGLRWDGRSVALATVVLVDLAHGQLVRAFTSEAGIALSRLAALGLPPLVPGAHVVDLTTTPGANVDERTEPDPMKRRDRLDPHTPGSSTYQRFRFTVTP